MKKLLPALCIVALAVALLASCGGGSTSGASPANLSTPTPALSPVAPPEGYAHVLVGTWHWDEDATFTYAFHANGEGFREVGADIETFAWITTADRGLFLTLDAPPGGFTSFEEWNYVIVEDVLTITNRQNAGIAFSYNRG